MSLAENNQPSAKNSNFRIIFIPNKLKFTEIVAHTF